MESKEKLNILILSWRGPGHPNAGGAEISTHEHAKKWVESGHSVTLFTSFYKNAQKQEWIDGINIIRRGNQYFGVHLTAFFWFLFGNHPKFDLVVDQFHGIPFFTPLYVRVKKLGFIHEVAKEVWKLNQFSPPLNFFVSGLGNILEPLLFNLYKGVPFMTVSESTKNDLVFWGIPKQDITVINNGITVLETVQKKEQKKTIVFLGALAKDKGIELALFCLNYLQRKFDKDIQFWIIGKSDTKYLKFLQVTVDNLGIKNTRFWGFVDEIKKFELLAKAHILINPSIREGWGLVVIEAASVGTPTIAFNVSGLKDSIQNGKTGLLSNGQSVEGLTNKVMELLSDETKLKQMSKNAILWSKNFSWEKSTSQSLDLINKVIKS